MDNFKRFTRSITLILKFVISILALYVGARLLHAAGLVSYIDRLYTHEWRWFFVVVISSRILFVYVTVYLMGDLFEYLHKKDFFWIAAEEDTPEDNPQKSEPEDKSGDIFWWLIIGVISAIVGEIVIRVAIWQTPPYFLWAL
jgi:hypothetical protein